MVVDMGILSDMDFSNMLCSVGWNHIACWKDKKRKVVMNIQYRLDKNEYSTIPCVHDCTIKEVEIKEDFLIFYFEDEINRNDSVNRIYPNAKTLITKYHLIDDFDVFVWKRKLSLTKGAGYIEVDRTALADMAKTRLVYLFHNVAYQSMILKLWIGQSVIVDLRTDYVEYEWIE